MNGQKKNVKKGYRNYRKNNTGYIKKVVQQTLNKQIEYKRVNATSTIACNSTGVITDIFNPGVGTLASERIGVKTTLRSIRIKGTFESTGTEQVLRIMLIKSRSGATPTMAELLEAVTPQSMRNDDYMPNYITLMDRTLVLGTTNGIGAKKVLDFYKRVKLDFSWTAANVHEKNGLFLVTLGTEAAGASAANFVNGRSMVFTDM